MKNTFSSAVGIGLLFSILLAFNALSGELFSRFYLDLTEEKLYSLSEGTENILKGLEDPVTLKLYYSKTDSTDIPGLRIIGDRITNLLREFARVGGSNLSLEIYDPRPDSEEADWATKYGLNTIPVQAGREIYFGLVGVTERGNERAIPVFNLQRQEFLEYDIAKLVYSLTQSSLPKVGILSSLDVRGAEQQNPNPAMQGRTPPPKPWFFVQQLEKYMQISYIKENRFVLPRDLDLLVLIHPKNLTDGMLYDIDQFVLQGGNLLVFVDPYCQIDTPDSQEPAAQFSYDRSSNLNKLLKGWGVELLPESVVGDKNLATTVKRSNAHEPESFVAWLTLNSNYMNSDDVVTSALENIVIPWGGVLKVSPDASHVTPIFWSSDAGSKLSKADYSINGGMPDALRKKVAFGGEKLDLAVRIQGTLDTNYPDGKPKFQVPEGESPNMSTENGHLAKSKQISNVMVFSDVDFISDQFSVQVRNFFGSQVAQRLNDNLSLVLNASENLTGSSDLISVRTRGKFSRPFTKVEQIQKTAELKWKNEEQLLTAKLQEANQRLQKFQNSAEGDSQILSAAVMEELQQFKQEKADTQAKLRTVRRSLREEVESLGNKLFVVNTFAVPVFIILLTLIYLGLKKRKKTSTDENKVS